MSRDNESVVGFLRCRILFYENMDAKSKGRYAVASSGWGELDNDNPIDALYMFV